MINALFFPLLVILLCATLGDLTVPLFIGKKYRDYNHLTYTISALGSKDSAVQKLECSNLIIVGALLLAFAIGQYLLFDSITWAVNLYTLGIVLFAIGCILAGIFPEDPLGVPETASGKVHGIASGLGFFFLIMNPLWAVWIINFNAYQIINIVLFIIGIFTFGLFMISENKATGILNYTGLYQRLNLIILYTVLILNYIKLK